MRLRDWLARNEHITAFRKFTPEVVSELARPQKRKKKNKRVSGGDVRLATLCFCGCLLNWVSINKGHVVGCRGARRSACLTADADSLWQAPALCKRCRQGGEARAQCTVLRHATPRLWLYFFFPGFSHFHGVVRVYLFIFIFSNISQRLKSLNCTLFAHWVQLWRVCAYVFVCVERQILLTSPLTSIQ